MVKAINDIMSIVHNIHVSQPYNCSDYLVWDENNTIIAKGGLRNEGKWYIDDDATGTKIDDIEWFLFHKF